MGFVPCQREYHNDVIPEEIGTVDGYITPETIREDCIANEIQQKEYIGGAINIFFLFNTQTFETD